MTIEQSYETMPDDLPQPADDGACNHLVGMRLPHLGLQSTAGSLVNLAELKGRLVIYCYPMTGQPGVPLPHGWDEIPGARGCTPQSCAYRDSYAQIQDLDTDVYGISTQSTQYQSEMADRLHLPFKVLSDENLEFSKALRLPTFTVDRNQLLKRLTIISNNGNIEAVNYPVFPSDSDPKWVIGQISGE